jgi:hypothetical protein
MIFGLFHEPFGLSLHPCAAQPVAAYFVLLFANSFGVKCFPPLAGNLGKVSVHQHKDISGLRAGIFRDFLAGTGRLTPVAGRTVVSKEAEQPGDG